MPTSNQKLYYIVCILGLLLGLGGFILFLVNKMNSNLPYLEIIGICLVVLAGICAVITFFMFKEMVSKINRKR